jgi:hydrogenase/urease accessory protein HupE
MQTRQRAGSHPGPFALLFIACVCLTGVVVRAHDPGLSTLEIEVTGARLTATLSLAAADARLAAPEGGDVAAAIGALAARAIQVAADERQLESNVERTWMDEGAAHVRLSFMAPAERSRIAIRSGIPAELARGHRQLLTVRSDAAVVAEHLLDASSGTIAVALNESMASTGTAGRLFALGVGHILAGFDHLVFLAGLLLASRTVRELVSALTAFTVAHSITLAAAASGLVHAPPSIVEPLIAASIAWVGIENLMRTRRPGVRWMVVFGFGLVHGFGFAEALIDLGRWSSASEIAITLLSFNGGVEAGQLAVAAALLPFVWLVRARPAWNARLVPLCSATIVAAGCYWLVERLIG